MGRVLHGSATTTEAIRRAIQHSQESPRALAKRYGVNQKTVAKWRKREGVADLPTGPKESKSTVLTVEKEAIIVAFRAAISSSKSAVFGMGSVYQATIGDARGKHIPSHPVAVTPPPRGPLP